jgi:hypothetical protein
VPVDEGARLGEGLSTGARRSSVHVLGISSKVAENLVMILSGGGFDRDEGGKAVEDGGHASSLSSTWTTYFE